MVEPWQMTEAEFKRRALRETFPEATFEGKPLAQLTDEEVIATANAYFVVTDETMTHKRLVQQALKEGKPVPAEVLKDYPGLAVEPEVTFPLVVLNHITDKISTRTGLAARLATFTDKTYAQLVKFSKVELEALWDTAYPANIEKARSAIGEAQRQARIGIKPEAPLVKEKYILSRSRMKELQDIAKKEEIDAEDIADVIAAYQEAEFDSLEMWGRQYPALRDWTDRAISELETEATVRFWEARKARPPAVKAPDVIQKEINRLKAELDRVKVLRRHTAEDKTLTEESRKSRNEFYDATEKRLKEDLSYWQGQLAKPKPPAVGEVKMGGNPLLEIHDLLPMSITEGPPLPKGLGLKWPWKR